MREGAIQFLLLVILLIAVLTAFALGEPRCKRDSAKTWRILN